MPDHFARIGLPRQPWLDPEELKARFLALSAEAHPDKATDKQNAETAFQAINEAYNVLRHSRSRLLHLLELEGAAKPAHVATLPPVALELFTSIAEVTKRADSLLKEKAAANSPMLKVQFFQKAMDCVDALQATQGEIQKRISLIDAELNGAVANWKGSLPKLQEAAAALGFLEKWKAQLQERSTALTF